MKKKQLRGLRAEHYEHPLDRKTLAALEVTPGLKFVVKKFYQLGIDRILTIQFTGSSIKVNRQNMPDLDELFEEACKILAIKNKPEFYIQFGNEINAFTAGVEKPILVINSGAVDTLSKDELLFLIGHELGHIKSQHVLYHQMAEVVPVLGNVIGSITLNIGELFSTGLQLALMHWHRMSEFSSDRAGLLACQSLDVAVSAMIKMAGLPKKYYENIQVTDFLKQAETFENFNYDGLNKVAKVFLSMNNTHPWTVLRGAEMKKWITSGGYQDLINSGNILKEVAIQKESNYCPECGQGIAAQDKFCGGCGNRFVDFRAGSKKSA